jgi:hypothetical protein
LPSASHVNGFCAAEFGHFAGALFYATVNLEGIVDATAELSLVVAEIVGVNDTQIVEVLVVDNGGAQEKRALVRATLEHSIEDFLDCFLVVEAEVVGEYGVVETDVELIRHHGYRAGPRTATSSWEPSMRWKASRRWLGAKGNALRRGFGSGKRFAGLYRYRYRRIAAVS